MQKNPCDVSAGRDIARLILFVTLVLVCVLFLQAWLQRTLTANGMADWPAGNLSFLVAPPLLLVMLYPVWKHHSGILRDSLSFRRFSWRIVVIGVSLGITIRLASWGSLIFQAGFGLGPDTVSEADFDIYFQCPPFSLIALHLLIMGLLVPLTEELIHRAWFVTWLSDLGTTLAIIGSALLFAMLHQSGNGLFPFIFGLLAARLYLLTQTIWGGLIAHAVFNCLIAFDWYCLRVTWLPGTGDAASKSVAIIGLLLSLLAIGVCVLLVSHRVAGHWPDDA